MKPELVTVKIRKRTRAVLKEIANTTEEDLVEVVERLARLEAEKWGINWRTLEERDRSERNL